MTGENRRFHAAGHLAAALALVLAGHDAGAKIVLGIVNAFVSLPDVVAPPALKEKMQKAFDDPEGSVEDIRILERWFVHPFNGVIEASQ